MRTIKFRARNANIPACWIYGYFVIEHDSCYVINDSGKFQVRAGTESEYTGLKDKNGKEVYEGDVVRVSETIGENTIHQVKFYADEGYPAFDLFPSLMSEMNGLAWATTDSEGEVEVIGNIYENPELLEQPK